jgi:hypothetical protein
MSPAIGDGIFRMGKHLIFMLDDVRSYGRKPIAGVSQGRDFEVLIHRMPPTLRRFWSNQRAEELPSLFDFNSHVLFKRTGTVRNDTHARRGQRKPETIGKPAEANCLARWLVDAGDDQQIWVDVRIGESPYVGHCSTPR